MFSCVISNVFMEWASIMVMIEGKNNWEESLPPRNQRAFSPSRVVFSICIIIDPTWTTHAISLYTNAVWRKIYFFDYAATLNCSLTNYHQCIIIDYCSNNCFPSMLQFTDCHYFINIIWSNLLNCKPFGVEIVLLFIVVTSYYNLCDYISQLCWICKWNEINRALGHLCAHIG